MNDSTRQIVLSIDDLTVAYRQGEVWYDAVQEFSLTLNSGQTVGLVGESGSGKTTVALAIMGYLGQSGRIRGGRIEFTGQDIAKGAGQFWGKEIALVPQDPQSSLNPSITIGEQIAEGLRQHLVLSRKEAAKKALELLESVRVPDPQRVFSSYPHQVSGGMQQRALIAMALSTEPSLLILDEPTTALDVTTQAVILDLFRELIQQRETAALYVTHNLGVVAQICQRVAVLYAGELVEEASVVDLFKQPLHPYSAALLSSVPKAGRHRTAGAVSSIPGQIPPLDDNPTGCVFAPRCQLAIDICQEERPDLESIEDARFAGPRRARCHRWPEILAGEVATGRVDLDLAAAKLAPEKNGEPPALELEDLHVAFDMKRTLSQFLSRKPAPQVKAVGGVGLTIPKGRILGLVGESGSGKTSLARAVVGLEESTSGKMESLQITLPPTLGNRTREMMGQIQMIFQNPEKALNPYQSIGDTLRRPLITLRRMSQAEAEGEVTRLLEAVRLPNSYAARRPDQLSGGEKQRAAIARAFAANPDLLLADEPVSALDVSVQASILNLLSELQDSHGISILFISHDLAVVGYLADEVAVIYAGLLMEISGAEDLFKAPYHPYTEALLSAVPEPDPEAERDVIRLEGDVPSQVEMPAGCPFHPRCPRFKQMANQLVDLCPTRLPSWQETPSGKRLFCHIPLVELEHMQANLL